MATFQSVKVIDGFSACFRQEKSAPIHCSKIHGYSIKFEVVFAGELDHRNWVVDFGFMKRSKTLIKINRGDGGYETFTVDGWFKHMFDHSVIVAKDDTQLDWFEEADRRGILNLRVVDRVGCEMFAKLVFETLNSFLVEETAGRVKVVQVRCFEHEKNSAIYL